MTAGTGPTHPPKPRPVNPPPPPRPALGMTGPTQPPGEPPTVPPKTGAASPSSAANGAPRGRVLYPAAHQRTPEPASIGLGVSVPHIDVTRPYAVVDGVHGWVTV